MSQSLHPMLNVAIKAARAAGAIINRAALDVDLLKVSVKGPNDFVSEVDRAAEEAMIEILLQAYPDHGILAEESGRTHGNRTSEYQWIIDPLDGTTNFLHGLPIYAVSIGLAHRNVVQQAVVYDPARNDLFFASRGPRRVPQRPPPARQQAHRAGDALIGTGFPFRRGDNFERYLQMMQSVMQRCAGLRRPGAAALDLCYVAAGWYDGFFETGLNPWDVAAGSLIDHRGRRPDRQLHRRARLPAPARDRRRQPQDLRPARAPAGAVHQGRHARQRRPAHRGHPRRPRARRCRAAPPSRARDSLASAPRAAGCASPARAVGHERIRRGRDRTHLRVVKSCPARDAHAP